MLLHAAVFTWTLLVQAPPDRLVIFHAGSLSVPLEAVEKEFKKIEPSIEVRRESAGSVESARKITDLHREADILAVADYKVIEDILFPAYASWSVIFARNHIVIAYTERSRFAGEINSSNWYEVLLRKGVEYGRSDPDKDPCGYRTLMVWQLAERFYGQPGLNEKLLKGCPAKNIRPKEVDIIAIQEAGDLDYHFQYKSVAEQHKLKYLRLPPQIDLGSYQFKDMYASAQVHIHGKKPGEKITMTGEPILYAVTIPSNAPHPQTAQKFLVFLLGPEGRKIFEDLGQEFVSPPLAVNFEGVPEGLKKMVAPLSSLEKGKTWKAPGPPLSKGMSVLEVYRNGQFLKRLTHEDLASLPQTEDKTGDLAPSWTIPGLLTSLAISVEKITGVVVTGAKGETLSIPGKKLADPHAVYLMGYNRRKNIKLMSLPQDAAWRGQMGHGPGAIRQVTRVDVSVQE